MNNLKQGLMEKSRLAKHAYEEGRRTQWKEAKLYKQKLTTSAESIKKRLTWHAS
jgi:hypothetical protein